MSDREMTYGNTDPTVERERRFSVRSDLQNRLRDARASKSTALALPFAALTLDGLYCIDPACTVCRRAQAGEGYVNDETIDRWGRAVS